LQYLLMQMQRKMDFLMTNMQKRQAYAY